MSAGNVVMLLTMMRKSLLREQMISHKNNQPSTGFYDSVRLNSKSDEEVKSKHNDDNTSRFKELIFMVKRRNIMLEINIVILGTMMSISHFAEGKE